MGTGRRWLPAVVAAALLLNACSADPSPPPAAQGSPTATSAGPSATPSATAKILTDRRPLLPVPDVRPAGFTDPPPGSGLARYLRQPLNWYACGDFRCATLLAPLDYAKPDAQAITLSLRSRVATSQPRLGSLFINPGGPGGSGVDYVKSFSAKGLEAYDVVGWDPRGVGQSTPVSCFGGTDMDRYLSMDDTPDDPAEATAWLQEVRAFGQSCLARSGPLLEHISTAETVRDLDLLRQVVGDAKLNYLGSSYGTQIGARYAQLFPANVGRMVLDGAVNITDDDSVTQLEGFERALGRFAAWCAEKRCRLGSSQTEVLASVKAVWAGLDAQPIAVGDRQLTQQLGVTGVLLLLYQDERGWQVLAQSLAAARSGDGRYLLALADQYNERDQSGSYGALAYAFPAVRCLDSADVSLTKAQAEWRASLPKAPIIGPNSGADDVCPLWPVPSAPEQPRITGRGAAPIVVIGTTGDPATPYEYAVGMAEQLESGVLLTYRGSGHLAYSRSTCIQDLVVAYLVRDQVPATTTC